MKSVKVVDGLDTNTALRVYMMASGLNASTLADMIGMNRSTFWRKLTGVYEFKVSEVVAIGKALGLSTEELGNIFLQ